MVSPSVSVTLNPTGLGYSLCFLAPVVNGSETDLQSVSFRSDFLVFFFFNFVFTYGLMTLFFKTEKANCIGFFKRHHFKQSILIVKTNTCLTYFIYFSLQT